MTDAERVRILREALEYLRKWMRRPSKRGAIKLMRVMTIALANTAPKEPT